MLPLPRTLRILYAGRFHHLTVPTLPLPCAHFPLPTPHTCIYSFPVYLTQFAPFGFACAPLPSPTHCLTHFKHMENDMPCSHLLFAFDWTGGTSPTPAPFPQLFALVHTPPLLLTSRQRHLPLLLPLAHCILLPTPLLPCPHPFTHIFLVIYTGQVREVHRSSLSIFWDCIFLIGPPTTTHLHFLLLPAHPRDRFTQALLFPSLFRVLQPAPCPSLPLYLPIPHLPQVPQNSCPYHVPPLYVLLPYMLPWLFCVKDLGMRHCHHPGVSCRWFYVFDIIPTVGQPSTTIPLYPFAFPSSIPTSGRGACSQIPHCSAFSSPYLPPFPFSFSRTTPPYTHTQVCKFCYPHPLVQFSPTFPLLPVLIMGFRRAAHREHIATPTPLLLPGSLLLVRALLLLVITPTAVLNAAFFGLNGAAARFFFCNTVSYHAYRKGLLTRVLLPPRSYLALPTLRLAATTSWTRRV